MVSPALPDWISPTADGVILAIKAVPRARATRAVGLQAGAVRVQIAAAPHHGQSNAALCAYLAECAGVRPAAVRLRRGSSGARKLIEVNGDPDQLVRNLTERFGPLADGA
ncbi:MAG TPA: DUF167 domain-containing protein [Miltoncostaeaceae bacterium]|nr:DUF167 domain-containing protein [Miltoncostaeaceae bacterium]